MAPTQSGSLLHILNPRVDDNDNEFNATPPEAIIVPVAILIVLLTSAATISVYRHWRRRRDHNRLVKAGAPSSKLVPDWLSIWIDPPKAKPIGAGSQARSPDFHCGNTTQPSGFANSDKDYHGPQSNPCSNPGLDSDTIALRPISVFLPAYPLTLHDPCDRYPHVTNYSKANDVRPKVMGVPLR